MAKVVEVSVFKPAAGKLDEYLSVAKDFKSYVLGAGVDEVWFNTGSVGRHGRNVRGLPWPRRPQGDRRAHPRQGERNR